MLLAMELYTRFIEGASFWSVIGWLTLLIGGSHLLLLHAFRHEYEGQPVARVRGDHSAAGSLEGHALLSGMGGSLIGATFMLEGSGFLIEGLLLYLIAFVLAVAFVLNGSSALVDYRFSAKTILVSAGKSVAFLWRNGVVGAVSGKAMLAKGGLALKALLSERKSATKEVEQQAWDKAETFELIAALGSFLYCPYVPLSAKRSIVEVMHRVQAGSWQQERAAPVGIELVSKVNNLLEQVRVAEQLFVLRSKNQGGSLSGDRNFELLLEPVWADLHELLDSIL